MALMEDEQLVLQWLSQYGPMTKGMIGKLFPQKSSATVGRLLMGLKRRNYITQLKNSGPHVEFCVSEFRQTQEYHVINVHDGGLFPLSTALPVG